MPNAHPVAMTEILPSDVLLGRGKLVHHHIGNVVYRKEVKTRSGEFQLQSSLARDAIARDILENVHRRGGRFLRPIVSGDMSQWEICPVRLTLTKVKQALRDFVRQDSSTATKTSSSSSYAHARMGGKSEGTEPAPGPISNLDSAASGVEDLLAPEESPGTSELTDKACSTEIDDGRSKRTGPHRSPEPVELAQSSYEGPQGHRDPRNEAFSRQYQLRPMIASLQHSMQHNHHELANYVIPRSRQGTVAHSSSRDPQAVPNSSSLPIMASLRSRNNDSSLSTTYANDRGYLYDTSSISPAAPTQQPQLPRGLPPPLDNDMSELLRRLRDGV